MRTQKKTAIMLTLLFSVATIGSTALAADGAVKPAVAKTTTKAPAKTATKVAAAATKAPTSQPAITKIEQVPAPTPTNAPKDVDKDSPLNMITSMIAAAKSGKWALFVGILLMLLTWLLNTLVGKKIPPKVLPWVAIGLGVIGQGAFAIAAGSGWLDAIVGGITMGTSAAGMYSAAFKYVPFLGSKKKTDEPSPAPKKADAE